MVSSKCRDTVGTFCDSPLGLRLISLNLTLTGFYGFFVPELAFCSRVSFFLPTIIWNDPVMSMPKKKIKKNIIFDLRILIKNFKKTICNVPGPELAFDVFLSSQLVPL